MPVGLFEPAPAVGRTFLAAYAAVASVDEVPSGGTGFSDVGEAFEGVVQTRAQGGS